jgi:hypothetical protein
MANELHGQEPTMDAASLYREELITDRRVGTIRVLTPVTAAGLADSARTILYVGETQVLTPGGRLVHRRPRADARRPRGPGSLGGPGGPRRGGIIQRP